MASIGLTVSAAAVVLAAWAIVLSTERRSTTVIVALVAVVLEAAAATVLPLERAQVWMVAIAYVALALAFGVWIVALVRGEPGGPDDDSGYGFGGGSPPGPPGPPDEPAWWPEFERELRDYMRDRTFHPA